VQRLGNALRSVRLPPPNGAGTRPTAPESACPICKGAGWIRVDVPVGHPNFGRAVMCDCKMAEVQERNLRDLHAKSNLDALSHLTFETFDPSVPGVADALAAAREFAQDPRGWLVFYGGFGAGKTHLAAAIAHELVKGRTTVLFQVVPALLNEVRAAFNPGSTVQQHELFNAILRVNVLILDDLGEEHDTPWVREQLYLIFNHRYNYRLPTVVTTNRPLDAIDPRICSRMFDRTLARTVQVDAGDFRHRELRDRRRFTGRGPTPRR
jgi:DNA replication protein DnaC